MRRIAIINQKGGVGKTTTAVNLSAALAEAGRRVLLIDIDPQAHATLHLGIGPTESDRTIYAVLTDGASLPDVRLQVQENLDIIASHIDLVAAEVELAGVVGRELVLREKLKDVEQDYDYLIVDCPPSLGVLTLNALAAVEEAFIPLQPHFLALHGLSMLLETISLVAERLNPRLVVGGVMFCLYDTGTRLAGEVRRDVEEFFAQAGGRRTPWSDAAACATLVRRNIRLAEAPSHGQSIFRYAPDSRGAEDYRQLAEELVASEPSQPPDVPRLSAMAR